MKFLEKKKTPHFLILIVMTVFILIITFSAEAFAGGCEDAYGRCLASNPCWDILSCNAVTLHCVGGYVFCKLYLE